jgi:hypothetical protein
MMQETRGKTRREFTNTLIDPYELAAPFVPEAGNRNEVYSNPKQQGMPEINRALEVTTKGDQQKDYYIGLQNIDEAVMWYFENVLKLSVIQNNTRLTVPVMYGSPESWKSMQVDGYYRDKEGKLQAPLVVFKRNSVTQNRDLGNKLDGNSVKNVQLFEKGYSKRNFYSNFPLLKRKEGRAQEKEWAISMIPDYVTIEYSCLVWTYYMEQMDKLIEALNFSSRAYWGDPNRFQFYSSIETFTDELIYTKGEDRAVKSSFNITLNGYLIPDSVNKHVATANRVFGVSNVVFGLETSNTVIGTERKIVLSNLEDKSTRYTDETNNR